MEAKRTALLPFLLALIGLMLALVLAKSAANAETRRRSTGAPASGAWPPAMDPTSSPRLPALGISLHGRGRADSRWLPAYCRGVAARAVGGRAGHAAPDRRTQRQQVVAVLQADAQRNSPSRQLCKRLRRKVWHTTCALSGLARSSPWRPGPN